MTRPAPADPLPARFGAYRVVALLGAGGMGRVYRGFDEALQRDVAIKTLLPALAADADFVARFTREARAAASLNHPNITQIYATGQEGAIPWFAMELIHGRSLESVGREQGAIDPLRAAGWIRQAALGLRHAALKGLIHRDIKPSNLMLTEDGMVKLTDFGLAKAAGAENGLTATGEVLGSPGYISPEQAQGHTLDLRSDIYSLGATFYHLVTGRLPFPAPTAVAMILKHMNEPLRSPRTVNPAIPFPVAAVVQKMMAKRAGERFQDYDALIAALDRAMGGETGATDTGDDATATRRRITPAPDAITSPMQGATGAAGGGVTPTRTVPLGARGRQARPDGPGGPMGGRSPATEDSAPAARRGLPLLPAGLMITVLALLAAGLWRGTPGTPVEPAGPPATAAGIAPEPPIAAGGSFTSHPAAAGPVAGDNRAAGLLPQGDRADLVFLENDQETLAQGGLRVHGRVRNAGSATARQARVRVRVLLDDGQVAAQGETTLAPATLNPGQIGSFDVLLDYAGPSAVIRSEILWSE